MAISVLQQVYNDDAGVTGLTLTVTLTNVTAGSTIHVFALTGSGSSTLGLSVADPTNGAYSALLDTTSDATNTDTLSQCFKTNVAHVAGALVITGTWTTTNAFKALAAFEIGGSTNTGPDGHTAVLQTAPGTGTDAITVGPPSPNNRNTPALIVALTSDDVGNHQATIGTGFTANGNGWGFTGISGAVGESKRVTGLATAATWTDATSTARINMMAVYDEVGATPIVKDVIFFSTDA